MLVLRQPNAVTHLDSTDRQPNARVRPRHYRREERRASRQVQERGDIRSCQARGHAIVDHDESAQRTARAGQRAQTGRRQLLPAIAEQRVRCQVNLAEQRRESPTENLHCRRRQAGTGGSTRCVVFGHDGRLSVNIYSITFTFKSSPLRRTSLETKTKRTTFLPSLLLLLAMLSFDIYPPIYLYIYTHAQIIYSIYHLSSLSYFSTTVVTCFFSSPSSSPHRMYLD